MTTHLSPKRVLCSLGALSARGWCWLAPESASGQGPFTGMASAAFQDGCRSSTFNPCTPIELWEVRAGLQCKGHITKEHCYPVIVWLCSKVGNQYERNASHVDRLSADPTECRQCRAHKPKFSCSALLPLPATQRSYWCCFAARNMRCISATGGRRSMVW